MVDGLRATRRNTATGANAAFDSGPHLTYTSRAGSLRRAERPWFAPGGVVEG
jgi:hypothetical protein